MGGVLLAHADDTPAPHRGPPAGSTGSVPTRPAQMSVMGALTILAGLLIVVGGLLLWRAPALSPIWLVDPSNHAAGPWLYWAGVAFGGIVALLGGALMRWPDRHATFGVAIIIAAGMSLLAGPLIWLGFALGIVVGALVIVVGTPAAPKLYFYTPMHLSLPPPMAPLAGPGPGDPAASAAVGVGPSIPAGLPPGRFCQGCGRSVSSQAEFCPWCGASPTPRIA
jgi:hypothetical protein